MDSDTQARLRKAAAPAQGETGYTSWNPQIGDDLFGTVKGYDSAPQTTGGGDARILLVQPNPVDGVEQPIVSVWVTPAKLKDWVETHLPREGASLFLRREENITTKNGNSMHNYSGAVEQPSEEAAAEAEAPF